MAASMETERNYEINDKGSTRPLRGSETEALRAKNHDHFEITTGDVSSLLHTLTPRSTIPQKTSLPFQNGLIVWVY